MDYEQKYNEALERAREYLNPVYPIADATLVQQIFPELAESDDERIRKELVKKISNLACGCFISQEQKQNFIAYLEKQKEQKPVAWSEEDKKILDDVSHILIGLNYKQIAKDYKQAVEKLIYARPSWKPSEAQMEALLWCTAHLGGADHRVLAELYEHLKKLM